MREKAHFCEFASTRIMSTLSAFRKVWSLSTCDLSGLMSCSSTTQMSFLSVTCGTAFAIAVKQYTCRPAHSIEACSCEGLKHVFMPCLWDESGPRLYQHRADELLLSDAMPITRTM